MRVVAFGVCDDVSDIVECARARVDGYVSCEAETAELLAVIATVGQGALGCSPSLSATLLRAVTDMSAAATPVAGIAGRGPRATGPLSDREREILSLVGGGLMNKQIARRLGISLSTVKNHVHNILQKEAVASRQDLVRRHTGVAPGFAPGLLRSR